MTEMRASARLSRRRVRVEVTDDNGGAVLEIGSAAKNPIPGLRTKGHLVAFIVRNAHTDHREAGRRDSNSADIRAELSIKARGFEINFLQGHTGCDQHSVRNHVGPSGN